MLCSTYLVHTKPYEEISGNMPGDKNKYIRWFEETTIEDVPLVGGKNASIGEMYRELTSKGVRIPNGFSVTADAYWHMLEKGGILENLKKTMEGLDTSDVSDLAKRGKAARDLILDAGLPDDLWQEIKGLMTASASSTERIRM